MADRFVVEFRYDDGDEKAQGIKWDRHLFVELGAVLPVALEEAAHEFGLGVDAEAAVDAFGVALHRVHADVHLRGDLFVAEAADEEVEREAFAAAEGGDLDAAVFGPALLMEPRNFGEDDVGDSRFAFREARAPVAAVEP